MTHDKIDIIPELISLGINVPLIHLKKYVPLIIVLMILISGYVLTLPTDEKEVENIRWHVKSNAIGSYSILYENGPSMKMTNLAFKLVDPTGQTMNITDESGSIVTIQGTVDEIRQNMTHYWNSDRYAIAKGWRNATRGPFYADYPDGIDNRTCYIVFYDHDNDLRIDRVKQMPNPWRDGELDWIGEGFAIRSIKDGGPAYEGCHLILSDRSSGKVKSRIQLPEPLNKTSMTSSLINGNYEIVVDVIEPIPINDITYWIQNEESTLRYKLPGNDSIRFEGNLSDILWNYNSYLRANESNDTIDNIFYADNTKGIDNRTLYFVFKDMDDDEKLSMGDRFYCRSVLNNGFGDHVSMLKLWDERIGKYEDSHTYINIVRFEMPGHLEWDHNIDNGTYVINLNDIQATIWHSLYFSIVNNENEFIDIEGDITNQSLGSFDDIQFNLNRYNHANNSSDHRTYGDYFYTSYGEILTLYIIWDDIDNDNYVTSGDRMLIRPSSQGGFVEEGYRLRIYEEYSSTIYGTIRFTQID